MQCACLLRAHGHRRNVAGQDGSCSQLLHALNARDVVQAGTTGENNVVTLRTHTRKHIKLITRDVLYAMFQGIVSVHGFQSHREFTLCRATL